MLSNSKLVQYVGKKPQKRDTVAGSGLVWQRGEVIEVETQIANRLLRYPDVWKEYLEGGLADAGDAEPATKKPAPKKAAPKKAASASKKGAAKPEQSEQSEGEEVSEDEINVMNDSQLRQLVEDAGLELVFEEGESVESMRAKVIAAASGE